MFLPGMEAACATSALGTDEAQCALLSTLSPTPALQAGPAISPSSQAWLSTDPLATTPS